MATMWQAAKIVTKMLIFLEESGPVPDIPPESSARSIIAINDTRHRKA